MFGIPAEAFFGLVGVVLGSILTLISAYFRDWRQERSKVQRIASMLLVEVVSQAEMVVGSGSYANSVHKLETKGHNLGPIENWLPPNPVVYIALASELGALPADKASSVVAFYGSVERAIELSSIPRHNRVGSVRFQNAQQIKRFRGAWKSAAFNALLAIRALEPIAKLPEKPTDETTLERLKDELGQIVEDGTPRLIREADAEQE